MKKIILSLTLLLSLLLSACEITVDVGPLPSGVTISNASWSSNHQADVQGVRQQVICDDRTTMLTYSFQFTGTLGSWESYLQGVDSGQIAGRVQLSLSDPRVNYNPNTRTVTVNYELRAGATPTLLAPQAIVPVRLDYSRLFLRFAGTSQAYSLFSQPIPVLNICPAST